MNKALEWELADEQLGRLLIMITPNFTKKSRGFDKDKARRKTPVHLGRKRPESTKKAGAGVDDSKIYDDDKARRKTLVQRKTTRK